MKWNLAKLAKNERKCPQVGWEEYLKSFDKKAASYVYQDLVDRFAGVGAVYVLAGDTAGWTQIERSVRGNLLEAVATLVNYDRLLKIGHKTQAVAVNFSANGEASLHDVSGTLQVASEKSLMFFPLRDSLDSDTYCYVVLSPEKAKSLRSACKKRFDELFASFE